MFGKTENEKLNEQHTKQVKPMAAERLVEMARDIDHLMKWMEPGGILTRITTRLDQIERVIRDHDPDRATRWHDVFMTVLRLELAPPPGATTSWTIARHPQEVDAACRHARQAADLAYPKPEAKPADHVFEVMMPTGRVTVLLEGVKDDAQIGPTLERVWRWYVESKQEKTDAG